MKGGGGWRPWPRHPPSSTVAATARQVGRPAGRLDWLTRASPWLGPIPAVRRSASTGDGSLSGTATPAGSGRSSAGRRRRGGARALSARDRRAIVDRRGRHRHRSTPRPGDAAARGAQPDRSGAAHRLGPRPDSLGNREARVPKPAIIRIVGLHALADTRRSRFQLRPGASRARRESFVKTAAIA